MLKHIMNKVMMFMIKIPLSSIYKYAIQQDAIEGNDATGYKSDKSNMITLPNNDGVVNEDSDFENSNSDHHSESEIKKWDEIPNMKSNTISGQSFRLKDKTLENSGDSTDFLRYQLMMSVFRHKNPLSNPQPQFIKTIVDMTNDWSH